MIDSNKKMMPSDAPPSALPSKDNSADPNKNISNYPQIKMCLYKYTYIWQYNGKSYWAYLTCINKCYIYGFKWVDYCWIPLKIKVCSIDAFVCY